LRESLSSLAMAKVAPVAFAWASAFASSGRSDRLPDSISDPEKGLALLLGRHPQITEEFATRHQSEAQRKAIEDYLNGGRWELLAEYAAYGAVQPFGPDSRLDGAEVEGSETPTPGKERSIRQGRLHLALIGAHRRTRPGNAIDQTCSRFRRRR
jgi:hypothetical protein